MLRYGLWSIGAGVVIALAIPPYSLPYLIWVALLPFFALLVLPVGGERRLFFFGWLAGIAAQWPTYGWAFDASPLVWLGIDSVPLSYALAAFGTGLPVFFFALWYGLVLVAGRRLLRGDAWDILTLGALWAVVEYLRTFAYSFHPFAAGGGAILGDHMGFGLLGFAFADWPLVRQFATIGGIYGLGFIAAAGNAALFVVLRALGNSARLLVPISALAVVPLALVSGGFFLMDRFHDYSRSVDLAVVQIGFPPEAYTEPDVIERTHDAVLPLLAELRESGKSFDVVITPENSGVFFGLDKFGVKAEEVQALVGEKPYRVIFDGLYPGLHEKAPNQIVIYDNERGFLSAYGKRFLMPYGEYMPTLVAAGIKLFGQERWLSYRPTFVPGSGSAVQDTKHGKLATFICSEILSPQLVNRAVRDGAELLTYSSSISILRNSPKYHAEILAMAKIWATATRRYLVYAANYEPSFVIDPRGDIVWESPDTKEKVEVVEVKLGHGRTPATRYPYGFVSLAGAYLGAIALMARRTKS